ncbi:efflux RND transporter periplasmic adaptor subunit [Variovorax sp. PAMC 28711]|uniref:efflux RND transporter periplasmic adaptor subunit n=1 Tax=Variovorax sp. PAMC 28711 TaxID=1795631 RepID=UPI00078EC79E|nr:efflux RND transporter periplasmic adaptor subunit [Variovorax sp. PAMC 28711]AMM24146.1 efflux transporter periplasmic adaptor subunit [Variovorax sp. PAMC 28711]
MRVPKTGLSALCAAALVATGGVWWFMAGRAHAAEEAGAAPTPVLQHVGAQLLVPEASPLRRSLSIRAADALAIEVPLSLPAAVEADPARLVKVSPPATGRVVSLDKGLGDAVRAGDVLFRIDSADVAQARSDAQKARAALALAAQALERQRALGSAGIAANREVEQARNDFEQAQSELARTAARLAQFGAAQGDDKASGRSIAVRSPVAGRVIDLAAAQGTYWNDITVPLMTVADLSKVFVTASAGEADLKALFTGQSARVTLDAFPGEALTGTVRYIGEVLDPDTRRVKVRMVFDNRDGHLKPGMFAQARFLSKAHQGLLLPMDAVVQGGLGSRVFVEISPWRFEPRVVQLGPKVGDLVEVVAGVKPGERVVVRDAVLLND